jgi:hypothetical protein
MRNAPAAGIFPVSGFNLSLPGNPFPGGLHSFPEKHDHQLIIRNFSRQRGKTSIPARSAGFFCCLPQVVPIS